MMFWAASTTPFRFARRLQAASAGLPHLRLAGNKAMDEIIKTTILLGAMIKNTTRNPEP